MIDTTQQDKLDRLFRQWQEQRQQGQNASVAELCRDCPELRLELERRIMHASGETKASVGLTNFLEGVLPLPTEDQPTSAMPCVPGYEILGELGRGGMGVVYKGFDPQLKRPVAIKMILTGSPSAAALLQRFKAEMESVAQLKHPNIVQIYECGEQNGRPYCVLEFVEGRTLQERLAGQPQSPREAAMLIAILARAIHTAHRKGIVHRDLKPANILMDETVLALGITTTWGCPKITDFGLVKRLGNTASPTAEGSLLGTPSYMSPEQASGENQTVGPASDIYTLGTLLYEAIAGRPPFVSANPVETMVKVLDEPPPPFSALGRNVPQILERICFKCLEKAPSNRYASASALAEDLENYLKGDAGTATLEALSVLRSTGQQRKKPWWLVAVAAVAIIAIGLFFWLGGKADPHSSTPPGSISTSPLPSPKSTVRNSEKP